MHSSILSKFLVFLLSFYTVQAFPTQYSGRLQPQEILSLGHDVWIENIAVRQNGALLLTTLSPNASVYEVTNPTSLAPTAKLLHMFPNIDSAFGIAETSPDVFVVAASNYTRASQFLPNTTTIFSLDFNVPGKPLTRPVTTMPEIYGPNGVTSFTPGSHVILIADSVNGEIWKLDTRSGKYQLVIHAPEMDPISGNPYAHIGINGVHVFNESVYFTNLDTPGVFRIKLNATTCSGLSDTIETLAILPPKLGAGLDDFVIAPDLTIFATTNVNNSVITFKPNSQGGFGDITVLAQDDIILAGDTAVAFGRTEKDHGHLYVVSSVGVVSYIDVTES